MGIYFPTADCHIFFRQLLVFLGGTKLSTKEFFAEHFSQAPLQCQIQLRKWTLQMQMLSEIIDRYHYLNMVQNKSAESNVFTSGDFLR